MSLLVLPQPVKSVLDPRLCVTDPSCYPVLRGGVSVNTSLFPAVGTSFTAISVAAALNSNLVYSRRVLLQVNLNLDIEFTVAGGAGANTALVTPDNFCLRQFPLASMIQDCRVQMGTQNFSLAMADLIHPLAAISGKSDEWRRTLSSTTATQPDRRQIYGAYTGTGDNIFGSVGTIVQNYEQSRGAFPMLCTANPAIAAGATGTATFSTQLCEPIMMSPFSWSADNEERGFTGIEQLYFNFTMLNNWARILCQRADVANVTINSITPRFSRAPQIIMTSITPSPDMAIPRSINYDWLDLSYTPSPYSSVTAGTITAAGAVGSVDINSSVLQFPTMPWKIMIYGRRRKTELLGSGPGVMKLTDSFVPMSKMSITFDNKPNLLSNMTQQSLYQLSQRNGVSMSYSEWIGYTHANDVAGAGGIVGLTGSVLLVSPVLDLSASSGGKAPGSQGNFSFQCTGTFYDTSGTPINTEMIVVPLYKASMNISAGVVTTRSAVISDRDIIDAEATTVSYNDAIGSVGGGWFDTLKGAFTKYAPLVRSAVDGASSLLSASGHGLVGGGAVGGSLEGRYRRR